MAVPSAPLCRSLPLVKPGSKLTLSLAAYMPTARQVAVPSGLPANGGRCGASQIAASKERFVPRPLIQHPHTLADREPDERPLLGRQSPASGGTCVASKTA